MRFLTAINTDVGIKKNNNQDSVLLMEAETEKGNILFAVVCDGMGGLEKGELASAAVIRAYVDWFENIFPKVLYDDLSDKILKRSMEDVLYNMNSKINIYGRKIGINLGTTVVALIIIENRYYCINIGDSRCYYIKDEFKQITKDHSYIQREIEKGRMTLEEALNHPQRNVLLQCIGANEYIAPDFYTGEVKKDEVFMLCSDGFRHVITEDEFFKYLNPVVLKDEEQMIESVNYLTKLNKNRHEEDNISVILVRTR